MADKYFVATKECREHDASRDSAAFTIRIVFPIPSLTSDTLVGCASSLNIAPPPTKARYGVFTVVW